MTTTRATRYHDISAGHRVFGHQGKCRTLHGHNYRIHLHCEASDLDSIGRVVDFSEIKARLCDWLEEHWDHKLLLWSGDPLVVSLSPLVEGIVRVPFNPTAERMAEYLVKVVGPQQLEGTGVSLVGCVVEETARCSASYWR